jgi:hypothetical protein
VAHLQILAQAIERERAAAQLREPHHEQLDEIDFFNTFDAANVVAHDARAIFHRPSPRVGFAAGIPWLGKTA